MNKLSHYFFFAWRAATGLPKNSFSQKMTSLLLTLLLTSNLLTFGCALDKMEHPSERKDFPETVGESPDPMICALDQEPQGVSNARLSLICTAPLDLFSIYLVKSEDDSEISLGDQPFNPQVCNTEQLAPSNISCVGLECELWIGHLENNTKYSLCVEDINGLESDRMISFITGDITPPYVIATIPEDGAVTFPLPSKVIVFFSKKMNPSSVNEKTLTVESLGIPVTGTVDYNDTENVAFFTPTNGFLYATNYTLKIDAEVIDQNKNALGKNYTWSFSTDDDVGKWVQVRENAEFSPRDSADALVFDGKLWLSNGYYHGHVLIRDLWSSQDGITWTLVNEATPYDGYSELVEYKGQMWAIKGSVWRSSDGLSWELVSETTPFGALPGGAAVVYDNKIWQMSSGNEVWNTTDGITWTRTTQNAPYQNRRDSAAVVVFNNQLCLLGGSTIEESSEAGYSNLRSHNDMWCSTDGENWEKVLESAPWQQRLWFCAQEFNDQLWILGGYDNVNNANLGDVWHSDDGLVWEEFQSPFPSFSPRHAPACYVFNESLWVVSGNTWPVVNEVWRLRIPANEQP